MYLDAREALIQVIQPPAATAAGSLPGEAMAAARDYPLATCFPPRRGQTHGAIGGGPVGSGRPPVCPRVSLARLRSTRHSGGRTVSMMC